MTADRALLDPVGFENWLLWLQVRAWQEGESQTWAMVCDWLAEQGKSVVQV
jgi:hypothetical protein